MNNVSVKKYFKTVNDNSLLKLGEMRFSLDFNSAQWMPFNMIDGKTAVMSIVSGPFGGKFVERNTSAESTEVTLTSTRTSYKMSVTGSYVISIIGYYGFNLFNLNLSNTNSCIVKGSNIKYMENLTALLANVDGGFGDIPDSVESLQLVAVEVDKVGNKVFVGNLSEITTKNTKTVIELISQKNIDGDIDVFASNTVLTRFVISRCGHITGNLSSLLNKPALWDINLYNSDVEGNINSLINNGALVLPALTKLNIKGCANITASAEDIATLQSLGVTVTT